MLYTIEDKTLTAMGDAVRSYTGKYASFDESTEQPFYELEYDTREIDYSKYIYNSGQYVWVQPLDVEVLLGDKFDLTKQYYVEYEYEAVLNTTSSGAYYGAYSGLVFNYNPYDYNSNASGGFTIMKSVKVDTTNNGSGYWDITKNLNYQYLRISIGENSYDAGAYVKIKIRLWPCDADKKFIELNRYTPLEMVDEVYGIIDDFANAPIIPEEALILTGDCQYRFAYNGTNWLIEQVGDKITSNNITNLNSMFYYSDKIIAIPFEINCKSGTSISMANMFRSCSSLKQLPIINNARVSALNEMFYQCYYLREIPDDYCDTWDWSYVDTLTTSYSADSGDIFYYCYSLRKLPYSLLKHGNPAITYSYSMYYNGFSYCYSLDEIVNLPIPYTNSSWTSNGLKDTFYNCHRLKNMTFALQEDGTPYVMKWKSQTIDLSSYVGYALVANAKYITGYNSGITADKEVKDDATYQALKNDPDWYTTDINYSRYNHDSAVATINSLPDCSATGTNTIKFKGASGALTDGGAINTLTEEEIAVAAAKGWTVSLV